MAFTVEFSAESERDVELIFDHLFESYTGFGEATETALDHAARRIMEIRQAAEQLSTCPIRGMTRADVLPGIRHSAIDRAIYWFDVDEAGRKLRILAVFFGGQGHIRRMLLRLLRQDKDI